MAFLECFIVALRLGLTSFGGPVAHLGYFHEAYVQRKQWLSEERYAELLSVCQFLPGPASSQLGAAIGFERGRWLGAVGAWLGFTLPSMILMISLAVGLGSLNGWLGDGWIQGLKLTAVAVVANAILGMRKKLCPDTPRMALALVVALLLFFITYGWMQPLMIFIGGMVGSLVFFKKEDEKQERKKFPLFSTVVLVGFAVGVVLLSLVTFANEDAVMVAGLVKTGTMVFGGGHVVLPLLDAEMVGNGLMQKDEFLAGYGAAQAVPGPMFSLSAYLGALLPIAGNPWLGGVIAVIALFAPGMILLSLGMPIWNTFKDNQRVKAGLLGANAAVVGLLLAALAHILKVGTVADIWDVLFVVVCFGLLVSKKIPAWLIVLAAAGGGALL